jgi:hypothetical protein
VVSYKASHETAADVFCSRSEFLLFLIHPPDFSALVAAEIPGREAGRNLARHVREFFLSTSFHTPMVLTYLKIIDMGPTALLPLRRTSCCGFLSHLKYIALSRV